MERPTTSSQQQPSASNRRDARRTPGAATESRHDRLTRELAEPSERRLDAQPEEPGYGHGV